ncbi:hypothetical protein B2G71_05085 [Novosphingobium sp. PC22D]|uniref:TonB-dependent receptor n=1 Tax=Novosphingobium sp. PC22D TaxID=1962403 RepID=UPI000BEF951C|nr:TonB-dependent receptor [Novosphingobium sp. PC22D]PEQ13697.1 hypothetical protein B2G71_05085 [Novosphingobium sp. PC22D]
MVRSASLIGLAAVTLASPALAREERLPIDVPASRLDQAVRALGRQSGASIGFRDIGVARVRVNAVRGRYTAGEAIYLMLHETGARARRVAQDTFLVEADPDFGKARESPPPAPSRARDPYRPIPDIPPVEIVVTGTKRDIPIEAYPGMVHIIDGDQLNASTGRLGSDAIAATTPSVVSTHLGPGRNKLFVRGIADSSFVGPTQSTVGQYWGNSRITYSAPDPSLKLFDVRRIEVLEGPQGTLYGAGSLGGIVRVVPRAPQLDTAGGSVWAGVEAVSHGQPGYDGGAVLNVPLVEDRLGLRVLAFGSVENGYIDDAGRGLSDVNDVDSLGGRASLRFDNGDDLLIDTSLVGQRIKGSDSQYAQRDLGGLTRSSAIQQPYSNDFLLADVVVRKSWGDIDLTTSLGYAYQNVSEVFEGSALTSVSDSLLAPAETAQAARFSQKNVINMFTAEVRLSKSLPDGTGWLLATSFLRNEAKVSRQTETPPFISPLTGVQNNVNEVTVYGEATVSPAERLNVTVGARAATSRLSGAAQDAVVPLIAYNLDPGAKASRNETRLLPSLAIAYQANRDLTLFARYQEGFRPGGIAVRREYVQRYEGDRVRTVEAGLRYRTGGLELETSASWTDWSNIQADLIDGFGFPTTSNVGDGNVFSAGFSGRWRPLPGLELDGAIFFNESKVTSRDQILVQLQQKVESESFNRLPNIADKTARVGFTWSTLLDDDHDLELTGFARYVGKSILGIGPILGQPQGDYLDTGLEASLRSGPLRFSLALSNLLDSTGNRFALGSPFQVRDRNQITPLKPRSLRLGLEFDF